MTMIDLQETLNQRRESLTFRSDKEKDLKVKEVRQTLYRAGILNKSGHLKEIELR